MTVFSACSSAILRITSQKPKSIFSPVQQIETDIGELVNEVATDIVKEHDWRALTRFETFVGDGTSTQFALPTGYDRMVLGQAIQDPSNWMWGYTAVEDVNEWTFLTNGGLRGLSPGWWIILGDRLHVTPAPTGSATLAYVSKLYCRPASGNDLGAFTKDDDRFVLDERLLTLGLIWRYRAQKGLEYAEDMATYEKALSQAAGRDRGARVIRKGSDVPRVGHIAWPWPLG